MTKFKPIPFKTVGDWADYNRCIEYVGYGEHERTDIEAYIREITIGDPTEVINAMHKGRLEHREPVKLYDWRDALDAGGKHDA